MKFLVIGLGSMGKRRIRCLQYLKEKDIIGFDLREDRRKEVKEKYGVETFARFEDAMAKNPDVFIISVPSNLHHHYAMIAVKEKKHFFTESNFLSEGIDDLVAIEEKGEVIAVPSLTPSHHPSLKLMKKFVKEKKAGKNLSFIYHLGAYLPDWHSWEDYRHVYYSKKETSGCKEMVAFELTWITWMFGKVKKVSAFKSKVSDLETDIDDVYQIILELENGILGNMMIDVISRKSGREMKLVGEEGNIVWNSEESKLKVYLAEKKEWEEYPEDDMLIEQGYSVKINERMYIEEIEDFLKALRGEKSYPYTFREEKGIINVLEAIDQSARTGKTMEVKL
ncbi:MAG: Gfo/Idh/MocA family oxidoreductase [bacterium]|nr:Gfo/Idh/MocA family oxidoreductase [bacterium]